MLPFIHLLFIQCFSQKITQQYIQPQDQYYVLNFQDFITSDLKQETKLTFNIEYHEKNDPPILYVCQPQLNETNESIINTSNCIYDVNAIKHQGYTQLLQVIHDESLEIISPTQSLIVTPHNNITIIVHSQIKQTYSLQISRVPYQQNIKNCQQGTNLSGFCQCYGSNFGLECNIQADMFTPQMEKFSGQQQYFLNLSNFETEQDFQLNLENFTSYSYSCFNRDIKSIEIQESNNIQISSQFIQECKNFNKKLQYIIPFEVDSYITFILKNTSRVVSQKLQDDSLLTILLSSIIPPVAIIICISCAICKFRKVQNQVDNQQSQKIQIQVDNRCSIIKEQNLCSICLETLINEKNKIQGKIKLITKIQCGHSFHKKCLNYWLENSKNTCPMCRAEITEKQSNIAQIIIQNQKNTQSISNENNA